MSSSSTMPGQPDELVTTKRLTPERLAEVKSLLRYESSISFQSARAKESMLLLVAEVERLWGTAPAASPVPAVDPDSRAAFLGRKLTEAHNDVVSAEPVNAETLNLQVRPENLGSWDWWLGRLHIPTGTTTWRGTHATAKGSFGRVTVLLTGIGVGDLVAAEINRNGGAL